MPDIATPWILHCSINLQFLRSLENPSNLHVFSICCQYFNEIQTCKPREFPRVDLTTQRLRGFSRQTTLHETSNWNFSALLEVPQGMPAKTKSTSPVSNSLKIISPLPSSNKSRVGSICFTRKSFLEYWDSEEVSGESVHEGWGHCRLLTDCKINRTNIVWIVVIIDV